MRAYQNSHKDLARSLETWNRKPRKNEKTVKKNLNAEFTLVSEDVSVASSKDSLDCSSITEVSELNRNGGITELESTPTSSGGKEEPGLVSLSRCGSNGVDDLKTRSVEAEILVSLLRQARIQILKFPDMDSQSKKVLSALVEMFLEELQTVPEEDRFADLLKAKTRIGLLCFLLWIIAMVVILFFRSVARDSFSKPPPT